MSRELYYECDGRFYDSVIRTDLVVTDEEIQTLCRQMKEGFSKIRNRSLANAFSYMNLVEAWGSGIPKLMAAMKQYGLKEPEFVDMEVAFRINLYRGQNSMVSENGMFQHSLFGTGTAGKMPEKCRKSAGKRARTANS